VDPDFTIIIPTKNEEADLPRLLESISRQGFPSDRVIVVDNDSTDATQLVASAFGVKLLTGGPNQSAQRNIGARCAIGRAIYFLDADMELEDGLIEEIQSLISSGSECIVVPERTIGEDWLGRIKGFERDMLQGDSSIEAARVFSTRIFFECGGYDPQITGGEDWLLSRRVRDLVSVERTVRYARHYEGRLRVSSLMRKYVKYGRGYYRISRLDSKMLADHTNPFRASLLEKRRALLMEPGKTACLVLYKLITYSAGLIGFVLEALDDARRFTSRTSLPL